VLGAEPTRAFPFDTPLSLASPVPCLAHTPFHTHFHTSQGVQYAVPPGEVPWLCSAPKVDRISWLNVSGTPVPQGRYSGWARTCLPPGQSSDYPEGLYCVEYGE
jgi:hypothetical protein